MTPELFWLTLSALFTAVLWVPFIVMVNQPANTPFTSFTQMPRIAEMSPAAQRANRAHLNMVETFLPFAVVVLIAHVAGVSNAVTQWACIAFFALRVAHAVGHITGKAQMPLRPIIFTASVLCTVTIGVTVLLA